MTFNRTHDDSHPRGSHDAVTSVTLVGLFEDAIDARNTLAALRKGDCPRAAVSLIVRDRKADEGGPAERHGAVAKAVGEADLNGHSGWLLGLASLIVPERGTFLVAGLLGAALANVTIQSDADGLPESALDTILSDFGFGDDEITYLESRILADAMLIVVTSDDQALLSAARSNFSDNNAVHIGAARTTEDVVVAASDLLDSPPDIYGGGDVVVTDVVAPLQTLAIGRQAEGWARTLADTRVIDRDGVDCGRIESLIAETTGNDGLEDDREQVRYAIVGFGGVLGIGRRFAAVPIELITISENPAQVNVGRDVLQQAPSFDPDAPFSRREEQVVCAYFGCTPYWTEE